MADFAATVSRARSTEIRPLAAFTRRFPVTSPIQVSPLEFLTTAAPSMRSILTEPEPVVSSASPSACSTVRSPTPVRSCTAARLVELDIADAGLVAALAEATLAAQCRHPGLTSQV